MSVLGNRNGRLSATITRTDSLRSYMEGVQAIVFDAEGTLFTLTFPVGEVYSEVCERFGVIGDATLLERILHRQWKARYKNYLSYGNGYATSEDEEREKWIDLATSVVQGALEYSDHSSPDVPPREIGEAIYLEFSRGRTRTLREGTVELLELLKERGITTAILSNNDSRLVSLVDDLGLGHLIDHLLPTAFLGYKKPSPLCYKRALEKIGTKASATVSLGNDLELDYVAPSKEGWKALFLTSDDLFSSGSIVTDDERIPPDRTLYSMDELLDLL